MKYKLYLLIALLGITLAVLVGLQIHKPQAIKEALTQMEAQNFQALYQNAEPLYQNRIAEADHANVLKNHCKSAKTITAKKTKGKWRILVQTDNNSTLTLIYTSRRHRQQLSSISLKSGTDSEIDIQGLVALNQSYTSADAIVSALLCRDYKAALKEINTKFIKDEGALKALVQGPLSGHFTFNTMPHPAATRPKKHVDEKHYEVDVQLQGKGGTTLALLYETLNPALCVGIQVVEGAGNRGGQKQNQAQAQQLVPEGIKSAILAQVEVKSPGIKDLYFESHVQEKAVFVKCVGKEERGHTEVVIVSDFKVDPMGKVEAIGFHGIERQPAISGRVPEVTAEILTQTKPQVGSGTLKWYRTTYNEEMGILADHYYCLTGDHAEPAQVYVVLRNGSQKVIDVIKQPYFYADYVFI